MSGVEDPEWYGRWRDEALLQLEEKNGLLKTKFGIGDWPRFDCDVAAGTLTFSDHGAAKVVAEIQLVGSTSRKAGNWLWAWANAQLPSERVADSRLVRAFGEQHGIAGLMHTHVEGDDLNALGWELTAVAVRITDALGAYRPPRDEGGALYLMYRHVTWASQVYSETLKTVPES